VSVKTPMNSTLPSNDRELLLFLFIRSLIYPVCLLKVVLPVFHKLKKPTIILSSFILIIPPLLQNPKVLVGYDAEVV